MNYLVSESSCHLLTCLPMRWADSPNCLYYRCTFKIKKQFNLKLLILKKFGQAGVESSRFILFMNMMQASGFCRITHRSKA